MIPIDNPALYDEALIILRRATGNKYLGRLVQMLLACKHYGHLIPRIGDPVGITTGELETLLDALYRKLSRTDPTKILILFGADYKVPSGIVDGGLKYPSNIWRNNLNFQKGYMCYAPAADLLNAGFRNPSRTMCPHLVPEIPGQLSGATCAIRPGARYRNEDHPKAIRKDSETGRYFVYDPSDVAFYSNFILPDNGEKLPIAALIVALYHDSILAAGRTSVSIADFAADFDMSPQELAQYFEDDPASANHQSLIAVAPQLTWTREISTAEAPEEALPGTAAEAEAEAEPGEAGPSETTAANIGDASAAANDKDDLDYVPVPKQPMVKAKPAQDLNAATATTSAPPKGSQWWSAEQAVRALLESDGWAVMDVSRLRLGCDIKASKGQTLRLIEVKSAVGTCAPTLTAAEYQQAKESRRTYVLAIVEYFDPEAELKVRWIQDPARLQMTERQVTQYFLPRSVWNKPATLEFPG